MELSDPIQCLPKATNEINGGNDCQLELSVRHWLMWPHSQQAEFQHQSKISLFTLRQTMAARKIFSIYSLYSPVHRKLHSIRFPSFVLVW